MKILVFFIIMFACYPSAASAASPEVTEEVTIKTLPSSWTRHSLPRVEYRGGLNFPPDKLRESNLAAKYRTTNGSNIPWLKVELKEKILQPGTKSVRERFSILMSYRFFNIPQKIKILDGDLVLTDTSGREVYVLGDKLQGKFNSNMLVHKRWYSPHTHWQDAIELAGMSTEELRAYFMVTSIEYANGTTEEVACCLKEFRVPIEKAGLRYP